MSKLMVSSWEKTHVVQPSSMVTENLVQPDDLRILGDLGSQDDLKLLRVICLCRIDIILHKLSRVADGVIFRIGRIFLNIQLSLLLWRLIGRNVIPFCIVASFRDD